MSYNPVYEGKITVPADSTMGEIMYNQALAAWQNNDLQATLDAFLQAKKHNYTKKNLYDYAIAVATNLKNDDMVTALATEAQQLYGSETSDFLGYVINGKLNDKKYDEALALIDQAIAQNPDNAQYYVIKGILLEQDEIKGDAKGAYAKAVEPRPLQRPGSVQLRSHVLQRGYDHQRRRPRRRCRLQQNLLRAGETHPSQGC